MTPAPLPPHEQERIAALLQLHILDTPFERAFDELVRLASHIAQTPIALISLVDQHRQWFKAQVGLEVRETSREISFCGHAILSTQPLCVPDTHEDPRFRDNPLVCDEPHIRFYLGVPLVLPGTEIIGTLCVIDRQPRQLSKETIELLSSLARQAVDQILLRKRIADEVTMAAALHQKNEALRQAQSYGLTGLQMSAAFPFHLVLDAETRIIAAGPVIRRLLPDIVGKFLGECFTSQRPHWGQGPYRPRVNTLSLLQSTSSKIILRGEFVATEETHNLLFLGSPWLVNLEELGEIGLTLKDFSIHDPVPDFMYLLQSKNSTVAELHHLSKILEQERAELQSVNNLMVVQRKIEQVFVTGTDVLAAASRLLSLVGETFGCSGGLAWDVRDIAIHVVAQWGITPPASLRTTVYEDHACHYHLNESGLLCAVPIATSKQLLGVLEWHTVHPNIKEERIKTILEGIQHSITEAIERWEVEQHLRVVEFRRSSVVQTALDAIVTLDSKGYFLEFNPAAERLFGWKADEVIGKNRNELLLISYPTKEAGIPWPISIQNMLGQRTEVTAVHRYRGEFPVELSVVRTDMPNDVLFTAFVRDITTHKHTESVLKEAMMAAEAANRAKTDFLATMSHEIRTPLNAILGMSDIALSSSSQSEVQECLIRVQKNGESLLGLINDILDISKIEAGQFDLEHGVFDIRELVEGVVEALTPRADQKDLEIHCIVHPEVPERIRTDHNRFRQVLVNLLGNAIKFTQRGEVRIELSVKDQSDGGPQLQLAVIDTGSGLEEHEVQRIFDKFWRSSNAQNVGGTGLGLAITRSVVEQMGGWIHVESKKGKGSTFSILLPLHAEPQQKLQELPFPSPIVCVILFMERLSSFVVETLSARGFGVQACSTPESAQQALQAGGLQVVIIDIEDPNAKTWVALARQCKAKVLGIAGMGRGEYGKKLGIEQIVMKPIGTRRLLKRVEELVGVQSIVSPAPMTTVPFQRPYQILLVEDNPDNQSLAIHTLRRAGYEVESANDGRAAIEAMDGRTYALVLMDIEMPNMDGLEATRHIRNREREQRRSRTPIVALTAHAMEGFRQRCIEVGMDGYATKPLSRQHLTNIASTWIDRRPLVLIVDDSPDGRELLRRYLEKDGNFRSICAADGIQALRYMEHDRIDAVILDMEMPMMDGCTVATRIRSMPYGQAIPILALTGHTGDDWRQRCMQAGCSEFMSKPLKRSTLISTLSNHLSAALSFGDADATQPTST